VRQPDTHLIQERKIISLRPLYDFAKKYKDDEEALRLRGSALGKEYCEICDKLTERIDEAQGFYLWGFYDEKRYWHTIYLGMAGFGEKKSLKKRIREELKDERCCIWRSVHTADRLHEIRIRIHRGQYFAVWERGMRKSDTTHILWAPAESSRSEKKVRRVEADLIEALNPKANQDRPLPSDTVQTEATEVFQNLRRTIHAARHRNDF
jgi:hypothetical protein